MKARLAASAALAVGIMIGGTGCGLITYQATTEHYDASDGVGADVGVLDVRNALVISEDGVDGNLVVTVINTGTADARLGVQFESGGTATTEYLEVPAESTLVLGGAEAPLLLTGIDTIPGALLPVYFQSGNEPGAELRVPVLDGGLPEYAAFVP